MVSNDSTEPGNNGKLVLFGITCVIFLAVAVFMAVQTFMPRSAPYATTAVNTAQNPDATGDTTEWMKAKARECGGDYSKLSPTDQIKLQKLTRGQGERVMKTMAGL